MSAESTSVVLRRGLPALLAMHAVRTGWALLLLAPLYAQLGRAIDDSVFRATAAPGDAAIALEVFARVLPDAAPAALGWLASYALMGPWLQCLLLHALAGASLRDAARRAALGYAAALGARALALAALAAVAGMLVLALDVLPSWLPADVAVELALRVAAVSVLLGSALVLVTSHDLVLARIVHGDGLRSALRAGLAGLSSRVVGQNLAALAASAVLVALAELAGRAPLELPYAAGPGLVLVVQQSLLLAALAARARWLALALSRRTS